MLKASRYVLERHLQSMTASGRISYCSINSLHSGPYLHFSKGRYKNGINSALIVETVSFS